MYRWEGKIEDSEEILLVIKTSRALFDNVRLEIEKIHSYEVPEVLALHVVDGAEQYLDWLDHALAHGRMP